MVRSGLDGGEPDRGPRRIGQPPDAVSPGRSEMVVLFVSLIGGGLFRAGDCRRGMGLSFLLSPDHHAGIARPMLLDHLQSESPSANRASILSLQSVSFRLCLLHALAPLLGNLPTPWGYSRLSPSPLFIPNHPAAFFTPLSQEHTRAERDMRNKR